jgi:myo-inositol catabolism protein IolC
MMGKVTDAQAVQTMAATYSRLCATWDKARAGESE